MENTAELFKRLESLAREWSSFARGDNYRGWEDYADGKVRCYFAENSDHKAVYFDCFEVGFHHPLVVTFPMNRLNTLSSVLDEAANALNQAKEIRHKRTQEEIDRDKEEKRKSLLEQLTQLDAEHPTRDSGK